MSAAPPDAESRRLLEDERREKNWKRWGPYLAERQWATVREDYSPDGDSWRYFPHEHARSRAYRWGEDGLLGICDRECRLCFAIALWNGADPFLKERLFGLTGPQGNHGEDVKELYFYLDSTPTHSYLKALYKYPQAAFPYELLLEENARRGKLDPEFELLDTGIFDGDRYFDVVAEYAKESSDDILIRIAIFNRGPAASLHVLPTLWFRNSWSWGRTGEGYWPKPRLALEGDSVLAQHASLGTYYLTWESPLDSAARVLFTENETNTKKLFGAKNTSRWVKDAFHELVVNGDQDAVNPEGTGTKSAVHHILQIPSGGQRVLKLRLRADARAGQPFGSEFDRIFAQRIEEADLFHARRTVAGLSADEHRIVRQARAGLLWSKQFYHYDVPAWLDGDPAQPTPPRERKKGRNHDWFHLYNRDVISMPDKWEYPWYAAWDLAFHMIPFAQIDPQFAKEQLLLFLREWYMHPNGQIPAYEFELADVNPPVHAWAAWRVYKMTGQREARDRRFLVRVFEKLLLNFTWWVNRKDTDGKHVFSGGFLGLDNIGVFDRSKPLPTGGRLQQADATAWMAFYCATMLSMALELAREDSAYDDIASKFFEHFVAIADAMNSIGGRGLWNEEDGFYYDQIRTGGMSIPLRVRSLVGLIPLLAVEVVNEKSVDRLPAFKKRMKWFMENRKDLARHITYLEKGAISRQGTLLLAVPSRDRLERVLRYLLDENEFLSPYGIRSLSRAHKDKPYTLRTNGQEYRVDYEPGESTTGAFGGNSNWRGPVWFPINYLLVEALERYHHFYGESLQVEFPTGSGRPVTLLKVAMEINSRLARLFLPDATGHRPSLGAYQRFAQDPHWNDLLLFHEYFHGETGRGLGSSHQTGWTALVARCIEDLAGYRRRHPA